MFILDVVVELDAAVDAEETTDPVELIVLIMLLLFAGDAASDVASDEVNRSISVSSTT